MDHNEVIRTMAAERYLLNELTLEDREAFEAHFFACSLCAHDLRAAAAFLQEARTQLPEFAIPSPVQPQPIIPAKTRPHLSWWRPAVVIPAFLALLAIVGYQVLFTVKAMRPASTQPQVMSQVALQAGNTSDAQVPVAVIRGRGVVLLINLPQPAIAYAAYTIDLQYPGTTQAWTQTVSASAASSTSGGPLSLLIPAAGLERGPYHLVVYGVSAYGHRALLDRSTLDFVFNKSPAHG